jgi:hypothetical protein
MLQFGLRDLLMAMGLAGLVGLGYRLGLLRDLSVYYDWQLLAGIAGSIFGLICLGQRWDSLGLLLVPAAPFWVGARNAFLQLQYFRVCGCCCGFSEQFISGLAGECWDQGCVGIVVVGLTLLIVLWIAFRRGWQLPWWLLPSLVICLTQLLVLNGGLWCVIRLGFGYPWLLREEL